MINDVKGFVMFSCSKSSPKQKQMRLAREVAEATDATVPHVPFMPLRLLADAVNKHCVLSTAFAEEHSVQIFNVFVDCERPASAKRHRIASACQSVVVEDILYYSKLNGEVIDMILCSFL